MAWINLDDGYAEHPKVVGLSDAALAMEIRALCYVGRRDTDGFVPDACLHLLTRSALPPEVAAELVGVGRWERDHDRGGYWIHDYLDYNPSSEQRRAKRAAAAERMRRLRSQGRSPDVRANNAVTSREVRDGSRGSADGTSAPASRSPAVRANTTRTGGETSGRRRGPGQGVAAGDMPPTGPSASDDAAASRNGTRRRAPDVRANSGVTSREVTRNSPRSAREVPGKFAFSQAPIEPTSGGSIGLQGEGVGAQPGGPSADPAALLGTPGSTEWETGRRRLVASMLARGETPRHATPAELEAWHATGRLPWDGDPAGAPQPATSDQSTATNPPSAGTSIPSEGGQP